MMRFQVYCERFQWVFCVIKGRNAVCHLSVTVFRDPKEGSRSAGDLSPGEHQLKKSL